MRNDEFIKTDIGAYGSRAYRVVAAVCEIFGNRNGRYTRWLAPTIAPDGLVGATANGSSYYDIGASMLVKTGGPAALRILIGSLASLYAETEKDALIERGVGSVMEAKYVGAVCLGLETDMKALEKAIGKTAAARYKTPLNPVEVEMAVAYSEEYERIVKEFRTKCGQQAQKYSEMAGELNKKHNEALARMHDEKSDVFRRLRMEEHEAVLAKAREMGVNVDDVPALAKDVGDPKGPLANLD